HTRIRFPPDGAAPREQMGESVTRLRSSGTTPGRQRQYPTCVRSMTGRSGDPLDSGRRGHRHLRTQARAHVVLFSSDLALASAPLVDYYGLRFQIEFNFRDTKQYWGLEDCMNITPPGVTNSANLSLFMVNVVYRLAINDADMTGHAALTTPRPSL